MKPIIAITCEFQEYQPKPGRDRGYTKLYHWYYHAIANAGGLPLIVPVYADPERAIEHIERADGIVFTGSDDYLPGDYLEPVHPKTRQVSPWRAAQDLHVARYVLDRTAKPAFGICGGLQLLNIADGGTLLQDIPSEVGKDQQHAGGTTHEISIKPGTRLFSTHGGRNTINSYHHQAIKRTGERLRVAAVSPDGVVEAVDWRDEKRFLHAVQWHPELLIGEHEAARALFAQFVAACKK